MMEAIAKVPAGRWAVGVSGGADSVCLLSLLRDRADLSLRVVHLDHETRGQASTDDAAFVVDLSRTWGLPCTVARRSEIAIEPTGNASADFRAARLALFRREVIDHNLSGVIFAHHRDDQAETVLQRLLRGAGAPALGGIRPHAVINDLAVLHPLLSVTRAALRQELRRRGLVWREDASNESPAYLRNRLRKILAAHPPLSEAILELGTACAAYRDALDTATPQLAEDFSVSGLQQLARPLADHAARRWLQQRGANPEELNGDSAARLVLMATDAASPARQHFPGGLLVRRRRGVIFVDRSTDRL